MFLNSVKHKSQILIFGDDRVVNSPRIKMYSGDFCSVYSVLRFYASIDQGLAFSQILVAVDLFLVEYA